MILNKQVVLILHNFMSFVRLSVFGGSIVAQITINGKNNERK